MTVTLTPRVQNTGAACTHMQLLWAGVGIGCCCGGCPYSSEHTRSAARRVSSSWQEKALAVGVMEGCDEWLTQCGQHTRGVTCVHS